jgi:signal transduction histidine kinase/CheY-like chemotaxis protein
LRVTERTADLRNANEELKREVEERKRAETALEKQTHDLGERVKELNCLYGVSRLIAESDSSLKEVLQEAVGLIPASWQYPDITCAKIVFEGDEFATENLSETEWKLSADIVVSDTKAGAVEAYYLEEKPEIDEGPFLKEERNLIDDFGRQLGIFAERKRAEEDRKTLQAQLVQAQKMESIGTLAGGIAHDFNNILSVIIGFTELTLYGAKKESSQYKNLREILIAGNRAKDLVQQILTFSRQADQEQKPVQVKLIVIEALKMLKSYIPSTIEIKQNVQSAAVVMGDSTQIHQVLMNLCTNAAHVMEEKGGVLTVNLSDIELDSEFISNYPDLKPGPYVNLTVTDTGSGMTPNVLDKIFDPFFTTKEKEEGTGLGLSVVHGIVHSHGGTIYAYSEPEEGSTFKVFIPAIERRLKHEDRVEQPIPTGTERILLIDDEPVIVNMSKEILSSLGYNVVTRTSSIEALEFFKAQPDRVDLVITDMTMPKMTGEVLAKEFMQTRSDIPVILCTGFSARIDEKKAKAMGIKAFVSKPVLKQEIGETVRKVLDEK